MSRWLFLGLKDTRLPAVCVEKRRMKAAMAAMVNKNGRKEARSTAQVVRPGWFKLAHVKSAESQELSTLLTTRGFVVSKLRGHGNEIRGALRPHGLRIP